MNGRHSLTPNPELKMESYPQGSQGAAVSRLRLLYGRNDRFVCKGVNPMLFPVQFDYELSGEVKARGRRAE